MKKVILSILILTFCTQGFGEESSENPKQSRKSAGYASREATVASMMGWGIGLFAGIATLCALLDNNTKSSDSSSQ